MSKFYDFISALAKKAGIGGDDEKPASMPSPSPTPNSPLKAAPPKKPIQQQKSTPSTGVSVSKTASLAKGSSIDPDEKQLRESDREYNRITNTLGQISKALDEVNYSEMPAQQEAGIGKEQRRQEILDTLAEFTSKASDEQKTLAAGGLASAVNNIKQRGSLAGKTYRDLVEEAGIPTQGESDKNMSTAEVITRLSMAILPGLAGYTLGRASGMANPFITGAAGAEAGMKGLQYLNELDKEKRERKEKLDLEKLKAIREELKDERRFEREKELLPLKEKARVAELADQVKLVQAREAASKLYSDDKEPYPLKNIRERRQELEKQKLDLETKLFEAEQKRNEALANRAAQFERLQASLKAKVAAAREKKTKPDFGPAEKAFLSKSGQVLVSRTSAIQKIENLIPILTDPNIEDGQKATQAASVLKQMNDESNPDAVQRDEAARLAPYITYATGKMPGKPGAFWGYDIPGFIEQVTLFNNRLRESYQDLKSDVDYVNATMTIPGPRARKNITAPAKTEGPLSLTADLYEAMTQEEKRKFKGSSKAERQNILKQVKQRSR